MKTLLDTYISIDSFLTTWRNRKNKKFWILVVVVILFIIGPQFFTPPTQLVKLVKGSDIDRIDGAMRQKLNVETSYDLGGVVECVTGNPHTFGAITMSRDCYLTTARAYYPHSIDATQVRGESVLSEKPKIPGIDFPYEFGTIGVATLVSEKKEDNRLVTSSRLPVLRSKGDAFASRFTGDIVTEKPLAKSAPTLSEALAQGRTPLVVVYNMRVCHSPKLIIVDTLCILPN